MKKGQWDFSGYATRANVKCSDGRVILPDAFNHMDGVTIPLVWQHFRDEPSNVLGHALLESRPDGVYTYGRFNTTEAGKNAKALVEHGDIVALSIYANQLIQNNNKVAHGMIREVSLVISGANPGAYIDSLAVTHADGSIVEDQEAAVMSFMESLEVVHAEEIKDDKEEKETTPIIHADLSNKTIGEVMSTFTEEQTAVVHALIGLIMEGDVDGEVEQSDDEGDNQTMKRNVFDGTDVEVVSNPRLTLTHAQLETIMTYAKQHGSLKQAFIEHAGTYGIDNIDYLFPDAKTVPGDPTWISRDMEWVSGVLSGTKHSPFSRIKSLHADITPDEARARGYVTGAEKVEEVFAMLRRITTPQTIYKKQKLDRDDIIDITDLDVVAWMKGEMRVMLNEEIARAVLVSDGRDPVLDVADKIKEDNVRPIWTDSSLYTKRNQLTLAATTADIIDEFVRARINYRGSGNPTLYTTPTMLTNMLLVKDTTGRRIYETEASLASAIRVKNIVEVPIMEGLQVAGTPNYVLRGIVVNLRDYTIGADKGGETTFFDDFDIDYNQYKYLYETRISGALTVPASALVIEQADA